MLSDNTNYFTKDNLDTYLRELAKEYKRVGGKTMPAEIILIGGAAIVANYGFRDMTTDVDAVIQAASFMKEAINKVADEFNLPNGWLNSDFMRTDSYSNKLNQYSVHYKQFYNVLNIRTVSAEYLIAMKLRSGRKYKKDLSDIVGILAEHERRGIPISLEQIKQAVVNLYETWDVIPEDSKLFIDTAMKNGDFNKVYEAISKEEQHSKDLLIKFEKDYPGTAKMRNADDIIKSLKKRNE